MSTSYGGIQLPKPKPMTMRFQKGQLVPNASSFKPTPFYAPVATSSNNATTRLRNMGSSTRKLGIAPMHIRTRKRQATRRQRSRRA